MPVSKIKLPDASVQDVHDARIIILSQTEYDALTTKGTSTIYLITE